MSVYLIPEHQHISYKLQPVFKDKANLYLATAIMIADSKKCDRNLTSAFIFSLEGVYHL